MASHTAATAADMEKFMTNHKIEFASNNTQMSLYNIRLHLRVYKKVANAVADPLKPQHEDSALHWFERNEELWGRRATQCTLQEQPRVLDTFTSSFSDAMDLRAAAQTLHVMQLRNYNVKSSVKLVAETAKALPYYVKIPEALIKRYSKYEDLLKPYSSLHAFHEAHPLGTLSTGSPVRPEDQKALPIYASEFLDVLFNDLLLPLFQFKKHASLLGTSSAPLAIPFVKDALCTLDVHYARENPTESRLSASASSGAPVEDADEAPVSDEEAEHTHTHTQHTHTHTHTHKSS